jgi:hypothetical protein
MPMSIKARIQRAQAQIEKQTKAIKSLQAKCPHPRYEKGLSIVACVQEVWMCVDCGNVKPLQYDWFADNPNG